MSGRVESFAPSESGCPRLASSKWSPPTRRDTKICFTPLMSSSQTTHGTVGDPLVIVPAATRGSSASLDVSLFSEQSFSAESDAMQLPEVVSTCAGLPEVPFPTACQWKPPSALPSATPFAANTRSLVTLNCPLPCSYHTTHGTVSFDPVKAMSGSTP